MKGEIEATSGSITGQMNVGNMTLGINVQGEKDGIYIDSNNVWFDTGGFSVGSSGNYIVHNAEAGSLTVKASKIVIGGTDIEIENNLIDAINNAQAADGNVRITGEHIILDGNVQFDAGFSTGQRLIFCFNGGSANTENYYGYDEADISYEDGDGDDSGYYTTSTPGEAEMGYINSSGTQVYTRFDISQTGDSTRLVFDYESENILNSTFTGGGSPGYYPYDKTKLYKMTVRCRLSSSDEDGIYAGVAMYDSGLNQLDKDGNQQTSGGTHPEHCPCVMENQTVGRQWNVYTGFFSGITSTAAEIKQSNTETSPAPLTEDTEYFKPYISSDGNVVYIDYIMIEESDFGSTIINGDRIVTGTIGAERIDVASLFATDATITGRVLIDNDSNPDVYIGEGMGDSSGVGFNDVCIGSWLSDIADGPPSSGQGILVGHNRDDYSTISTDGIRRRGQPYIPFVLKYPIKGWAINSGDTGSYWYDYSITGHPYYIPSMDVKSLLERMQYPVIVNNEVVRDLCWTFNKTNLAFTYQSTQATLEGGGANPHYNTGNPMQLDAQSLHTPIGSPAVTWTNTLNGSVYSTATMNQPVIPQEYVYMHNQSNWHGPSTIVVGGVSYNTNLWRTTQMTSTHYAGVLKRWLSNSATRFVSNGLIPAGTDVTNGLWLIAARAVIPIDQMSFYQSWNDEDTNPPLNTGSQMVERFWGDNNTYGNMELGVTADDINFSLANNAALMGMLTIQEIGDYLPNTTDIGSAIVGEEAEALVGGPSGTIAQQEIPDGEGTP
jgi:hypothetical protein